MKDLLLALVDFFFEINSNNDYTLKEILMVILKVIVFLLILFAILYFLLENNETIVISD